MTTKPQPAPLPYALRDEDAVHINLYSADGRVIGKIMLDPGFTRETAEFIVKACNCHYSLVRRAVNAEAAAAEAEAEDGAA